MRSTSLFSVTCNVTNPDQIVTAKLGEMGCYGVDTSRIPMCHHLYSGSEEPKLVGSLTTRSFVCLRLPQRLSLRMQPKQTYVLRMLEVEFWEDNDRITLALGRQNYEYTRHTR